MSGSKGPTPHQREVLVRIARQTRSSRGFARSEIIKSRGACVHLEAKGLITAEKIEGPRGGTTWIYRATARGLKLGTERFYVVIDRPDGSRTYKGPSPLPEMQREADAWIDAFFATHRVRIIREADALRDFGLWRNQVSPHGGNARYFPVGDGGLAKQVAAVLDSRPRPFVEQSR